MWPAAITQRGRSHLVYYKQYYRHVLNPPCARVGSPICVGFSRSLWKVAYAIVSGPWIRTFVRYGYDPRTDPKSLDYQVVQVKPFGHRNRVRDASSRDGDSHCPAVYTLAVADLPQKPWIFNFQLADLQEPELLAMVKSCTAVTTCDVRPPHSPVPPLNPSSPQRRRRRRRISYKN